MRVGGDRLHLGLRRSDAPCELGDLAERRGQRRRVSRVLGQRGGRLVVQCTAGSSSGLAYFVTSCTSPLQPSAFAGTPAAAWPPRRAPRRAQRGRWHSCPALREVFLSKDESTPTCWRVLALGVDQGRRGGYDERQHQQSHGDDDADDPAPDGEAGRGGSRVVLLDRLGEGRHPGAVGHSATGRDDDEQHGEVVVAGGRLGGGDGEETRRRRG